MTIRNRTGAGIPRNPKAGDGRRRRILAGAGLALAIAAVAAVALTGAPEPAHACLLPGIPC